MLTSATVLGNSTPLSAYVVHPPLVPVSQHRHAVARNHVRANGGVLFQLIKVFVQFAPQGLGFDDDGRHDGASLNVDRTPLTKEGIIYSPRRIRAGILRVAPPSGPVVSHPRPRRMGSMMAYRVWVSPHPGGLVPPRHLDAVPFGNHVTNTFNGGLDGLDGHLHLSMGLSPTRSRVDGDGLPVGPRAFPIGIAQIKLIPPTM